MYKGMKHPSKSSHSRLSSGITEMNQLEGDPILKEVVVTISTFS